MRNTLKALLRGASSVLDLMPHQSDQEALQHDMDMVGQDMWEALETATDLSCDEDEGR